MITASVINQQSEEERHVAIAVDDRIKKLENDYDAAFKALKQRIAERASGKPQT